MGEITNLILIGELDYRTGEYIGPACGYPRTKEKIRCRKPNVTYNRYGYNDDNWDRMKPGAKVIVKFLYELGYRKVSERQRVIDKFLLEILKVDKLPKNSRAYHLIYDQMKEFKDYVRNLRKESK